MYEFLLTASTLILGSITVVLSIYAAVAFGRFAEYVSKDAAHLSRAVSWQLYGEAVIGGGTMLFASAELLKVLQYWGVTTNSSIRIFMFTATAATTLHLVYQIRKLRKK